MISYQPLDTNKNEIRLLYVKYGSTAPQDIEFEDVNLN